MIAAAFLLLAAQFAPTEFEHTVRVPAMDTRRLHFQVKGRPAALAVTFEVEPRPSATRLIVIHSADEARFLAGRPYTEIASGEYAATGKLKCRIATPGDYLLVTDNRHQLRGTTNVKLHGTLIYDRASPVARTLPPERQMAVIAVSLLCFSAIVWLACVRLIAVMPAQKKPEPPPPFA